MIAILIGAITLSIWLVLWLGWARFRRIERCEEPPEPESWPAVVAVIPARDEEPYVDHAVESLTRQDHAGPLRVVVVDDHSQDRTGQAARDGASRTAKASAPTFLTPPPPALFGHGTAGILGATALLLMALLYLPMLRRHRQSPLSAPLLPATALLYVYATVPSAWRHPTGRAGWWKGRSRSTAARG